MIPNRFQQIKELYHAAREKTAGSHGGCGTLHAATPRATLAPHRMAHCPEAVRAAFVTSER